MEALRRFIPERAGPEHQAVLSLSACFVFLGAGCFRSDPSPLAEQGMIGVVLLQTGLSRRVAEASGRPGGAEEVGASVCWLTDKLFHKGFIRFS